MNFRTAYTTTPGVAAATSTRLLASSARSVQLERAKEATATTTRQTQTRQPLDGQPLDRPSSAQTATATPTTRGPELTSPPASAAPAPSSPTLTPRTDVRVPVVTFQPEPPPAPVVDLFPRTPEPQQLGDDPMAAIELVPSRLLDDDELLKPAGVRDRSNSLQDVYGVPWQIIVRDWNGVTLNKQAIDQWVMRTGGKRLAFDPAQPFDAAKRLGWAVFTKDSVIMLRRGGPRVEAGGKAPPSTKKKALGAGAALLALGAAVWALND